MINQRDEVHFSFLMAKSRIAPIKPISIPRLELTAAVVSVNVTRMLKSELDVDNVQCYYYTDSEIVIGYINNDARRFHVYVGTTTLKKKSRPLVSSKETTNNFKIERMRRKEIALLSSTATFTS